MSKYRNAKGQFAKRPVGEMSATAGEAKPSYARDTVRDTGRTDYDYDFDRDFEDNKSRWFSSNTYTVAVVFLVILLLAILFYR